MNSKYVIPEFVEIDWGPDMSAFNDYQVGVLRNLLADRMLIKDKLKHLANRVSELGTELHGCRERLEINAREIRELVFGEEREREE